MRLNANQREFFELLKAGIFPDYGKGYIFPGQSQANESIFKGVDWGKVYQMAQEQSVQGLVLRGIDELKAKGIELSVPKVLLLQWIGEVQVIEQRNKEMNVFVANLIEKLRKADIYSLLVKGQGIAQCYEKPLWRSPGDVDLLLSDDNYEKAKRLLDKIAESAGRETTKNTVRQHQEYQVNGWTVELHGTMHANLSRRIDRGIDNMQCEVFCGGQVRSWLNGETQVFLPRADEDVIFVFTHIMQHLFLEGIGLRQICDWCRLLYTFREKLNLQVLEERISRMGLMTEWKVLASLAVQYIGMPESAIPMFGSNVQEFKWEAARLMDFVLRVGNFGHNREVEWSNGFKRRKSLIWHRITDTFKLSFVFPLDAPRFLLNYAVDGVRGLMRR